MNATLTVKTTIHCDTCGCDLRRTKAIKVVSTNIDAAKMETADKIQEWKRSLVGQNCKVCASILKEVG